MNFLRKIFSRKTQDSNTRSPHPGSDNNANMIKAYDAYGREMYISKQQWRDNVLLDDLEKKRDDPDQLSDMLVVALQDGFAGDVIPYAEHLQRIDPIPSRSATILGIVYMENGRLKDAENIFREFLSKYGDDGIIMTNLAKVFSRNGDSAHAESTLWRALEIDPNQDNGLDWYAAIHRERGGETEAIQAYRRVAKLPTSWRAQLWLARYALERRDLSAAETLYEEVFSKAKTPTPPDLLMQMSGDLGNNGYLKEIIQFVAPHFDPATHGIQVGNNLIKAHRDLGQIESARHVLNQLYAQKRHDWQETLNYWDTELAKADVNCRSENYQGQPSVTLMSVAGPLWTRDESPFASLLPDKSEHTPTICVLGSTVLTTDPPKQPKLQLSDTSGRLSRGISLLLAERIHLHTNAIGVSLIPWVQQQGFAVLGHPYNDNDLCDLAAKSDKHPDFFIAISLDATQSKWRFMLRLIRVSDRILLTKYQVEVDPHNIGPASELLTTTTLQLLAKHAGISTLKPPEWYTIPREESSDYLLRLEQQLAVTCMHLDFLGGGGLSGEREILDGIIHLCARQPTNCLARMLLAQTIRQMQKTRPFILPEYGEKLSQLWQDHPLPGKAGELIRATISKVMAGET